MRFFVRAAQHDLARADHGSVTVPSHMGRGIRTIAQQMSVVLSPGRISKRQRPAYLVWIASTLCRLSTIAAACQVSLANVIVGEAEGHRLAMRQECLGAIRAATK